MESIVVTWRELLLVGVIILAVYIAEMLLLMRVGSGSSRWLGRKRNAAAEAALQEELAQIKQRVELLEARLGPVQTAAEAEMSAMADATPYNRAIQMARQGRDAARISESCGISRGEAELIVSMHGEI